MSKWRAIGRSLFRMRLTKCKLNVWLCSVTEERFCGRKEGMIRFGSRGTISSIGWSAVARMGISAPFSSISDSEMEVDILVLALALALPDEARGCMVDYQSRSQSHSSATDEHHKSYSNSDGTTVVRHQTETRRNANLATPDLFNSFVWQGFNRCCFHSHKHGRRVDRAILSDVQMNIQGTGDQWECLCVVHIDRIGLRQSELHFCHTSSNLHSYQLLLIVSIPTLLNRRPGKVITHRKKL